MLFVLLWEFRRPSGIISLSAGTIFFSFLLVKFFWQYSFCSLSIKKSLFFLQSWFILSLKLECGADIFLFFFISLKMSILLVSVIFDWHVNWITVSLYVKCNFPFAAVTICFLFPTLNTLTVGGMGMAFRFIYMFCFVFLTFIYKTSPKNLGKFQPLHLLSIFFPILSSFLSFQFHALLTPWCHLTCPWASRYYYLKYCFFLFFMLDYFCFYTIMFTYSSALFIWLSLSSKFLISEILFLISRVFISSS